MKPLFSPIFHSVRPRMKNHALFLMAWFALSASAVHAAGPAGAVLPDPLDLKSAIVYALDHNYAILQSRELIRQRARCGGVAAPIWITDQRRPRSIAVPRSGIGPRTMKWFSPCTRMPTASLAASLCISLSHVITVRL